MWLAAGPVDIENMQTTGKKTDKSCGWDHQTFIACLTEKSSTRPLNEQHTLGIQWWEAAASVKLQKQPNVSKHGCLTSDPM